MATNLNFKNFFKSLAQAHKVIDAGNKNTFFQGSIEQILSAINGLSLSANDWCMALEPPERVIKDSNSDNLQKTWLVAFHIFKNSSSSDNDYEQDQQILDQAENFTDNFVHRVLYERHYNEDSNFTLYDEPTRPDFQLRHFDLNTVEYQEIDKTLYHGRIGIRCQLELVSAMNEFDKSQFNDL